jgi:hypothetical protein
MAEPPMESLQMTTKVLNGNYPSGYTLKSSFAGVGITRYACLQGTGLITNEQAGRRLRLARRLRACRRRRANRGFAGSRAGAIAHAPCYADVSDNTRRVSAPRS